MLELILLTGLAALIPIAYFSDEKYSKNLFSYFLILLGIFTVNKMIINHDLYRSLVFGGIFVVTSIISNRLYRLYSGVGSAKKIVYIYVLSLIGMLWITSAIAGSLRSPHYINYYLKFFIPLDYIQAHQKPIIALITLSALISLLYTIKHRRVTSLISAFIFSIWFILIVLEFFGLQFSRPFHKQSLRVPNGIYFGVSVDAKDKSGYTQLVKAVNDNDLDKVKSLINRGADINLQAGIVGSSPIRQSIIRNHYEIFQFLLENKADYTIKTKFNSSLLSAAALIKYEDTRFIEDLIKLGIHKLEVENPEPPLHIASQGFYNHKESKISPKLGAIRLLVESGFDVNGISSRKTTPLYHAIQGANFEGMKLLIELGADPHLKGIKYPSLTNIRQTHDSLLSFAKERMEAMKLVVKPGNAYFLIQQKGYKNIINYLQ